MGLGTAGTMPQLQKRLIENLPHTPSAEPREIPNVDRPADVTKHVFIPLDDTIRQLEALLQKHRVVFLRAGVATGKSTLAEYLCRSQPSKFLQVFPPPANCRTFEGWEERLRNALQAEATTAQTASKGGLREIFSRLYENEQVLVFDEGHFLLACPTFYQEFLKLSSRPMVLLLSAASEVKAVKGEAWATPPEITAKFLWRPAMPDANPLADQLVGAGVFLTEGAVSFFLQIAGGHRGIFMAAMMWVQEKQKKTSQLWNMEQAYSQVKLQWKDKYWADPDSFLGALAQVRAVRVNGPFADLANIPQEFLEILCGGPMDLRYDELRTLTVHGFLLPGGPGTDSTAEEFIHYDWSAEGALYHVANNLLASYYRSVLKTRQGLELEVNMNPTSCIDLFLRAVPYLDFVTVLGGLKVKEGTLQSAFSSRGLPVERQYTSAINAVLTELGFDAGPLEDIREGQVDIAVTQPNLSRFAIEAVMAAEGPSVIDEHRTRFDTRPNYRDATRKCLLIIGSLETNMRQAVKGVRGGIEVVGLVANRAHTGYRVYVKKGENILDFSIPCDGVARSFIAMDQEPGFEIGVAQKFLRIAGFVVFRKDSCCKFATA